MNYRSKYIEVVDFKFKKDRNGKTYKVFTLRNVVFESEEKINGCKLTKLAVYDKPGSDLYYKVKGDLLIGEIVTREVEPYEINGKVCRVCTFPVFYDPESPSFDEITIHTFAKRGRNLVKLRTTNQTHLVLD